MPAFRTASLTNQRTDAFGGDLEGRMRFPLEIIKAVRASVGQDFAIIYRLSALDLVEGGMTGEETLELARRVEQTGADILSTGVGWHEADVPTVSHNVPRAAWSYAVRRIKSVVSIPVMASNRINDPGGKSHAAQASSEDPAGRTLALDIAVTRHGQDAEMNWPQFLVMSSVTSPNASSRV